MSQSKGLLAGGAINKESFNAAGGGLISIDDDDTLDIETQTIGRIWKYVFGCLPASLPLRVPTGILGVEPLHPSITVIVETLSTYYYQGLLGAAPRIRACSRTRRADGKGALFVNKKIC